MAKSKRSPLSRHRRLQPRVELVEARILLSQFVVSNTQDSGSGSLRQAILSADDTTGPDTITFAITPAASSYVINLLSPLPAITQPVVVDGTSQPGYAGTPIIEINGGGMLGDGLLLTTGSEGSTIEGLDITNFADSSFSNGAGIHIQSNGNLLQANFLGTDLTGKVAGPGNFFGVYIDSGSNNTIGGAGSAGNLISGNLYDGILIYSNTLPAQDNLVIGNKIGTDITGTAALPNGSPTSNGDGVDVYAPNNTIGATNVLTSDGSLSTLNGNLISGNQGYGILLGGNDNVVQGNLIGTDLTGTHALGNLLDGVTDTTFGVPGDTGNTIGGTGAGAGNVISANGRYGVSLFATTADVVVGNIVGTTPGLITDSPFKFQPLGNANSGILVTDLSTQNIIGLPGTGNLVVANQGFGIEIDPSDGSNLVSGNAVGTTLASGSSIGIGPPVNLGNESGGISVSNASGNTIGGSDQIDANGNITLLGGNVVSSNGQAGISVSGNDMSLPGNQGTVILGNLVGTSADGSQPLGNVSIGIMVGDSANNTIGGANQLAPDGSLITFNGNLISGNGSDGLQFTSAQTTTNIQTAGNLVIGNRIGTNLVGSRALPNAEDGVIFQDGASHNTIGAANLDGTTANLISGNAQNGIDVQDTTAPYISTGNVILGNRIGLSANGMAALPNLGDGIVLNAAGNVIGGTATGAGNIISGNLGSGVRITNSLEPLPITNSDNNQILGNLIGLDVTGVSSGVGNVESGVEIDSASGTTIGGTAQGAGNVISGNRQAGVELTGTSTATVIEGNIVGLDATGTADQGNLLPGILLDGVSGNSVGGNIAGAGNILSNNATAGLEIENGSSNNQVEGNLIGTDPSGSVAMGPIQNGVLIVASTGNTIGGAAGAAGNLISGNGLSGVFLSGSGAASNIVLGNMIGTDRSGTVSVPNGLDGVQLDSAVANTIGGTAPGAQNLISANRAHGVEIHGTSTAPGRYNVVEGNLIGTTDSGASPLGNGQDGIFLAAGAVDNLIGGTTPAAGNLISSNQSNGVELFSGATGNQVMGNQIGTDLTGTFSLGNNNAGISINNASANSIGGPTNTTGRGAGNLISGNRSSGVLISGAAAVDNLVQGNLIGTDTTASLALPNLSTGITIDGAANNLIGGDQPGAGNVIGANRTFGVLVIGSEATGNQIAGNLIGTNSAGASNLGNALDGLIINDAPGNTIGGSTAAARNAISGNGGNGIDILNITGQDGISILGNFIGTNPAGTKALANALDGILLNGVVGTVIAASAQPNLISGNTGNGIHSIGSGGDAIIQGNLIGTDLSGTASLGNGNQGIELEDSGGNTVGGLAAGQGNLISGNLVHGIRIDSATSIGNVLVGDTIGTDITGTVSLGNGGYGISIEGTSETIVQADLVSGNGSGGVQITGFGATGNDIFGCTIGTDRAGAIALGNGLASQNNGVGIFINGAAGNQIGGAGAGQGNLISGNATTGIYIFGRFASGNTIVGNRIGTNAAGLSPLFQGGSTPIQQVGILINQAPGLDLQDVNLGPGNTIGGTTPGAGNLISGNVVGIEIAGAESQGNVVSGNWIGPASNGGGGAGNTMGVYINGAPGNIIGGPLGNVISGNSSVGIYILGSPSTGNQITGNIIGLEPTGLERLPNQSGIYIENAPGNVLGGTTSASRNVISANLIAGVYILGAQSVGNIVDGNLIGYAANGTTHDGNGQYGVLLYNAPSNTVILSGRYANRITSSGIANYRIFIGQPVSANSPAGKKSQKQSSSGHSHRSKIEQRQLVVGHAMHAEPVRGKGHGGSHRLQ